MSEMVNHEALQALQEGNLTNVSFVVRGSMIRGLEAGSDYIPPGFYALGFTEPLRLEQNKNKNGVNIVASMVIKGPDRWAARRHKEWWPAPICDGSFDIGDGSKAAKTFEISEKRLFQLALSQASALDMEIEHIDCAINLADLSDTEATFYTKFIDEAGDDGKTRSKIHYIIDKSTYEARPGSDDPNHTGVAPASTTSAPSTVPGISALKTPTAQPIRATAVAPTVAPAAAKPAPMAMPKAAALNLMGKPSVV